MGRFKHPRPITTCLNEILDRFKTSHKEVTLQDLQHEVNQIKIEI